MDKRKTDKELMSGIQQGDPIDFNELWRRHCPALKKMLSSEGEDVMQIVAEKVWTKAESYSPRYSVKSWLFTITKNTYTDLYRKSKPYLMSEEADLQRLASMRGNAEKNRGAFDSDLCNIHNHRDLVETQLNSQMLCEQAMAQLTQKELAIFSLEALGFTSKEIAHRHDCSDVSIRMTKKRARARIAHLKKDFLELDPT